ncbi:6-phosphogluconolactonase [Flavobacterium sp. 3-218]
MAAAPYKEKINWNKVFVFWGDERWVPMDDDMINAKMSYDFLLNHVNVPKANIFPMYKSDVTPEDMPFNMSN